MQPQNPSHYESNLQNDLFDLNFLQNFSFSPSLTLNKLAPRLTQLRAPPTGIPKTEITPTLPSMDKILIPTNQLLQVLFSKDDEAPSSKPKKETTPQPL